MKKYKFLTIYKGRNSITYLAKEFEEKGENATPYSIKQNPSENVPFHKFTLAESDAIQRWDGPETQTANNGSWNKKILKELLRKETND